MSLLQSEFITLKTVIEATNGTLPTTGWVQLQVEPDGVQQFARLLKKLARSPLSSNMMDEKGDIVDEDATPKIVHDFNKDFFDQFAESAFRAATKFPGGTGTGRWVNRTDASGVKVTAVTTSQFTVDSGGAVPANVLVVSRGFANAANNGVFVVQAASTATAIKVTGTVAEASPPAGATVEVCGYQGTSGDVTATTTGLASGVVDFTTLGLQVGAGLWVGGGTAAAPGALGFTGSGYRGIARITSVATHAIGLDRTSSAQAADTAAGKTIQIFFGPWLRNVPNTSGDYKRVSSGFDVVLPNVGAGGVTDYVPVIGAGLGMLEINAALASKLVATASFIAFNVQDPVTVEPTGASTPLLPRSTAFFNDVGEMKRLRVFDTNNNQILVDIQGWKLTINNNIKPYKVQGYQGNKDLIFGKFQAALALDGSLTQDDLLKSAGDNRTLQFDALVRNNDCGIWVDIPGMTVDPVDPKFAANDVAKFSSTMKTFRDPTYNFVCGMTEFPSLPAS